MQKQDHPQTAPDFPAEAVKSQMDISPATGEASQIDAQSIVDARAKELIDTAAK
jgi:hypothetical protein